MRFFKALVAVLFAPVGVVAGMAYGAFRIGFDSGVDVMDRYADEAVGATINDVSYQEV